MDIRIKYSKQEVEAIVLEYHTVRFGIAPEGESWSCSGGYYGEWEVENIKDKEESAPIPEKEVL